MEVKKANTSQPTERNMLDNISRTYAAGIS